MDIREQGSKKYELLSRLTYEELLNMVGERVWVEYDPDYWEGSNGATDGLEEVVDNGEEVDLADWYGMTLGCVEQNMNENIIVYKVREIIDMKHNQIQGVLVARESIEEFSHLCDLMEVAKEGYTHPIDLGTISYYLLIQEDDTKYIDEETHLIDNIVYGSNTIVVTPSRIIDEEAQEPSPRSITTVHCERVVD